MKKEIPILDNFCDDMPFLTAESWLAQDEDLQRVAAAVKKYKIKTAVFTWGNEAKKLVEVLSTCDLTDTSPTGTLYTYKKRVLIYILNIGAPNAAAAVEELRVCGIKNFIAFGSAGNIRLDIDESNIIIVDRAIRDEGTSYHYAPPALYSYPDESFTKKLIAFLSEKDIRHTVGTAWSTDAFYRETKGRIAKRISQGCLAVDMECSALASVCKFHNLRFCEFLYFSDAVKQDSWVRSGEDYRHGIKLRMLKLALEFADTL